MSGCLSSMGTMGTMRGVCIVDVGCVLGVSVWGRERLWSSICNVSAWAIAESSTNWAFSSGSTGVVGGEKIVKLVSFRVYTPAYISKRYAVANNSKLSSSPVSAAFCTRSTPPVRVKMFDYRAA